MGKQQISEGTWDMCDEKSNAGPKVTKCHSDKCQSKGDPGNPFKEFAVCGTCLSQLRKMMIKTNVPGPFTHSFVLEQGKKAWKQRSCYCYASDKGKKRSFSDSEKACAIDPRCRAVNCPHNSKTNCYLTAKCGDVYSPPHDCYNVKFGNDADKARLYDRSLAQVCEYNPWDTDPDVNQVILKPDGSRVHVKVHNGTRFVSKSAYVRQQYMCSGYLYYSHVYILKITKCTKEKPATCSDEKLCIVAAVEEVGNHGKGPVRAVWKAGEEIPALMAQQCPDHKKMYDFGGTDACSVN